MTDYSELNTTLKSMIGGVPHTLANLANAAALLYLALDGLNWAGFYLAEGDLLVLGPFQGKPACIEIPFGKGVCGTSAVKKETLVVPNVHEFTGHIACDSASKSEIVIPVFCNGRLFGVLDLDSPLPGRFTETDKAGLEDFVKVIQLELETQF